MSASASRPVNETSFQVACELVRDGLRQVADGVHMLSLVELPGAAAGPRLVPPAEEVLLTLQEALAVAPVSESSLIRLAKSNPNIVRHVGRRRFFEKSALLRATRR